MGKQAFVARNLKDNQGIFVGLSGKNVSFSSGEQAQFERELWLAFSTGGVPFIFTEKDHIRNAFASLLPKVNIPNRRSLGGRILNKVYLEIQAQEEICLKKAAHVTIEGDSWQNIRKEPHLTFNLITADKTVIPAFKVYDWTGANHDAENLMFKLLETKSEVEKLVGVSSWVIAFVFDGAGEGRKEFRLLPESHPELVVIWCLAHQTNLIAGDLIRKETSFKVTLAKAVSVISFIVNRGKVNRSIQAEYKRFSKRNDCTKSGQSVQLCLPNATRWNSSCDSGAVLLKSKRLFVLLRFLLATLG